MRILFVYVFIALPSFFGLLNCAQSSNGTRKPVSSINILNKSSICRLGDPLSINVKTRIKDGTFRNTELFFDGNSIFLSDKSEFSYVVQTKNLKVGTHYLKVISSNNEGLSGENYYELILLSDIVPKKYSYKIIRSFPHNINHFTEGLEIKNGFLYEGTGQEGSSAIYKSDLSTGKILKEYKLDDQYFGEGITILNGKLYQLTYKSQIGFVRDIGSFELLKSFHYKYAQGWGLTNDGRLLIMSDGSDFLYYLDPDTFKEIKKIQVCNNKETLANLNELEYINGEIWANIWTTDKIVKINPENGKITGEIDLSGIIGSNIAYQKSEVDVLNGIAYDSDKKKLYVTGKLWPKIFEIELIDLKQN